MPDLSLKGVRLPELHLPEMSRDDIGRAIGDARRDVDLSRLDPRRVDLSGVRLPDVDLPRIDLPRAVTSAAQSVGIIKRPSRAPMVIGALIVAALVAIAAAMSPVLRPKIDDAARRMRAAVQARRDEMHDDDLFDADDAPALDAVSDAPTESAAAAGDASQDPTPSDGGPSRPEGRGNGVEQLDPAATVPAGNAHS